MPNLLSLAIFGLAVWRIASLFVHENGPFDIFRKVREWVGIQHDENGNPWIVPDKFAAQLLSCVWCASLWISLFFFIFFMLLPDLSLKIATIFSFSTIAILIETYIGKHK